jgi:hypothetical protein
MHRTLKEIKFLKFIKCIEESSRISIPFHPMYIVKDRPGLSSERAPDINKPTIQSLTQNDLQQKKFVRILFSKLTSRTVVWGKQKCTFGKPVYFRRVHI